MDGQAGGRTRPEIPATPGLAHCNLPKKQPGHRQEGLLPPGVIVRHEGASRCTKLTVGPEGHSCVPAILPGPPSWPHLLTCT
eukprot:12859355-Ditylum_brightwellii.AAC.1